jgi:uncharacterized glyoxalase superfamily protein PhnB
MVRVADLEEHFEKVKQTGANIYLAPETCPYGERQFTVQDTGGQRGHIPKR